MKPKKMTTLSIRNPISRPSLRRGFLLLALAWFALSPTARAVTPAPDGGYPSGNTAVGDNALLNLTSGRDNTAIGFDALINNTTGSSNIALGPSAGVSITTGKDNIYIGNKGTAGKSNTIHIGTNGIQKFTFIAGISGATVASGVGVIVDTNGHLGTIESSARFKEAIKPMDKASEAILALQPVTFRYKQELDPEGIPQFGLVAEQVEKVNPDLVARDDQGKPYTVRYEAVNAMLLNEFLKEHRKVETLEATVAQLKSTVAQQQEGMKVFTATLKEQASQIQKVSAQLEVTKPAPQMVANNQ
jgi:trimeric autotransporter adhesin